jgi:hypothetical protein
MAARKRSVTRRFKVPGVGTVTVSVPKKPAKKRPTKKRAKKRATKRKTSRKRTRR